MMELIPQHVKEAAETLVCDGPTTLAEIDAKLEERESDVIESIRDALEETINAAEAFGLLLDDYSERSD